MSNPDIRKFFGGGGTTSSKTLSGNKPPPPKETKKEKPKSSKNPNPTSEHTHKDGGPKIEVETKPKAAPPTASGSTSQASASKHFPSSSTKEQDAPAASSATKPKPRTSTVSSTAPAAAGRKASAIVLSDSEDSDGDAKMTQSKPRPSTSGAKPAAPTKPSASAPASVKASASATAKKRKSRMVQDSDESDEEEEEPPKPVAKGKGKGRASAVTIKPKKVVDDFIDDDDEDEDEIPKKKKVPPKKPPPKKAKVEDENAEEAPKPKKAVPAWIKKQNAGPQAPGSKEIPIGQDNCLAGLTFVFTGELESISRDEAINLCKRYGGRNTTGPSRKTDYVVVGSDAGPKKMEKIAALKLKTINEDEYLALIGSRGAGEVDEKTVQKQAEAEKKVVEDAKKLGPTKGTAEAESAKSQLWTVKYAPKTLKDLCGNKGLVDKLQKWLQDWDKNRKANFSKPGKEGTGLYRCLVLSGAPGIGKTTAAHLVCQLEGWDVIELNASDTRSKKLFEAAFRDVAGNQGLGNWLAPGEEHKNLVLIMDEVDGMSAGDRGGVGALTTLIRKTQIPIIAIANDMSLPKMKPLKHIAHTLSFKRPDANAIRSRMMSIAFKEGLKMSTNVVDQLIQGSQSDIRQVVNMMSTYKLSATTMSFDQGKALAKMNEKDTIQSPWNLTNRLFAPGTWSPNSGLSLDEKNQIYFHDFTMIPMFVQEGYLTHNFALSSKEQGRAKVVKDLELMSKAADAISDGDLVDRMIHGTQQQWSLMPIHGMFSCVRPAYWCHGPSQGGYGMGFPTWFGKNSTAGKLNRLLGEVQIRMRLKVSGDRNEIRQNYLPVLYPLLFDPLVEEGAEGIEKVIELMDQYYLTKDEWDGIVEILGLHKSAEERLKTIPSSVKSAFTRTYNKQGHPIPFHKASDIGSKVSKKLAAGDVPDIEDAFEVSDDGGSEEDEKADGDDVSNDKLIKNKAKKAPAGKKAGGAKAKAPKKK